MLRRHARLCWFVGGQDAGAAYEIMSDLQHRVANRPDGKEKAVSDHAWTLADMVAVLEEWEARQPRARVGRKLGHK